jgi:hypothetical protein
MHLADTGEAKDGMGKNMGKYRKIMENIGKYVEI